MQSKYKDETRWVARLIAVYLIILISNGFVHNILRLFSVSLQEPAELIRIFIALIFSVVFYWLGFRMLICSSLWNILAFLEKYPLFMFIQRQYFGMNKHFRSALTGSMITLLIIYPIPLMLHIFKDTWGSIIYRSVYNTMLWPFGTFVDIFGLNPEQSILFFTALLTYLVAGGFVVGGTISLLAGQVRGSSANESFSPKNDK